MASAWGLSWGTSWGVSWGATDLVDPEVVITIPRITPPSVSGADGPSKVSAEIKPILRQTLLKDDDTLLREQLILEDEELISIVSLLIHSGAM